MTPVEEYLRPTEHPIDTEDGMTAAGVTIYP
jgi:hypothetical protein